MSPITYPEGPIFKEKVDQPTYWFSYNAVCKATFGFARSAKIVKYYNDIFSNDKFYPLTQPHSLGSFYEQLNNSQE